MGGRARLLGAVLRLPLMRRSRCLPRWWRGHQRQMQRLRKRPLPRRSGDQHVWVTARFRRTARHWRCLPTVPLRTRGGRWSHGLPARSSGHCHRVDPRRTAETRVAAMEERRAPTRAASTVGDACATSRGVSASLDSLARGAVSGHGGGRMRPKGSRPWSSGCLDGPCPSLKRLGPPHTVEIQRSCVSWRLCQ